MSFVCFSWPQFDTIVSEMRSIIAYFSKPLIPIPLVKSASSFLNALPRPTPALGSVTKYSSMKGMAQSNSLNALPERKNEGILNQGMLM